MSSKTAEIIYDQITGGRTYHPTGELTRKGDPIYETEPGHPQDNRRIRFSIHRDKGHEQPNPHKIEHLQIDIQGGQKKGESYRFDSEGNPIY